MSRLMSKTKAAQVMKESLLEWICIQHATDQHITRPRLRDKALKLVDLYKVEGYKCGESWLTQFLKRYKFSPTLTECCGPEFENFADWVEIIRPLLSSYRYEDQFILDELTMFTDFKPSSPQDQPARDIEVDFDDDSLNTKDPQSPPMNIVSMMLAVNASGTEKMPPIISGRYKLESSESTGGCIYQPDNFSHINDGVLAGWLKSMDNKMAASNRKIILVLNRSRINAVKFAELTHIQPVYLPNKFPSKLRPLRRDVFHFIKMYYRSSYVEGLCQKPTKNYWEPVEIINCLVEAWNNVSPELIIVNFQRTKFRNDDFYLSIKCPQWDSLNIRNVDGSPVDFERYITFDDCLCETKDGNFNLGLPDRSRLKCESNVDTNLRRSFSRDGSVSKFNLVEDSRSSQDLGDGSLTRPSDDSVDENSCEPMDYSNAHRNFPINSEDNPQQNIQPPTVKVDNYPEETEEITGWKSAGSEKPIINLATDRSAGSDQIEEVNSTDATARNSPVNTSNHIVDKNYHTNFNNRMNQSCEHPCSHCYYPDSFFYQNCSNSSNTITNLDQKYERYDSNPEKLTQVIYSSSPIPSTSKQGLEESDALQRLYSGGADNFYNNNNNIHQLTPTVIVDKDNEAGAGDRNSKRPHPNEDTCIHTPAIENYDYVEEPPSKKFKYEAHWSDCYQQQPVFGPNYNNSFDHPVNLQTVAIEPTDATDNARSIFTLTDNTQGQYGTNEK